MKDALLADFSEENKKCFEDSQVVEKMRAAYKAIKENFKIDLFTVTTGARSIEGVIKTTKNFVGAIENTPLAVFKKCIPYVYL